MKFDKKDSKLLKNTKKFVYVSAITGVLLTGTQVGQFASTYTAHADETAQNQKVTITFVDQFGNQIEKQNDDNTFNLASYSYQVQPIQVNKDQILSTLAAFPNISKDTNDVPAILDLSTSGNYTFHLTQPVHTLTINLVDQNGHTVYTETNPNATQYTQTSTKNLIDWAQQNNYGYNSFPRSVDNGQTTVNIPVIAPTTTVVNQNTQQNNTTTETTTQSSASTPVQSSASDEATKSSAQSSEVEKNSSAQSSSSSDDKKESASSASTSETTKPVEQSSEDTKPSAQSSESTEQSSSATKSVKSEADSSVASSENASSTADTSTESSAQSSNVSSSASQASKSDEKTMVIVDHANKGEEKKTAAKETKQTPVAEKKDVRAKLPQTGDNTNQARAIAFGVATIALGLGLAYFGLRRKNK
ncbi:hypothetical protein RZ76_06100 [Apilactobacillus kunkeei]|uniref:LPXTG cell wall anchor domain-containing protein n=1 Tax=Apilactobacillus kunkeei TaxID=148814 RepID=UPI0006CE80A1|nr:LPXTG cell wall anchor domain-containing protein [Apilactobacillus kunkeei]KPN83039.1 hypothetical protein RZ76_06100 [Apilactobacillus kunkeei]